MFCDITGLNEAGFSLYTCHKHSNFSDITLTDDPKLPWRIPARHLAIVKICQRKIRVGPEPLKSAETDADGFLEQTQ